MAKELVGLAGVGDVGSTGVAPMLAIGSGDGGVLLLCVFEGADSAGAEL